MKVTVFLVVLLMLSCGTRKTSEDIDLILNRNSYKIECQFQGCFGSGTEKLEIQRNGIAVYTFSDYSDEKGPIERGREVLWTREKQMLLKDIFEIGITLQDTTALCTTSARYVLTSWVNSVEFDDLNCKVTSKFEELVK